MRACAYCRVSKNDGSQTTDNQLTPLRNYARAMNWEIVKEYVEMASGGSSDREEFLSMLDDADKRQFDIIIVWSLDRFSREGMSNMLGYCDRLKKSKVGLRSLQEPWMDISDEGVGQVLLAFMAWQAKQERSRIVARTKAGLQQAIKNGKKLGRPMGSKDKGVRRRAGYLHRYLKEGR